MQKYFISVLFLVIIDQLSKHFAGLHLQTPYPLTSFFSFTLAHNYGAAFSFLADMGGWQRYLLSAISIIASIVLAVWMHRTALKQQLKLSALALILAGALGNMLDRVFQGFVVDFIDLHYLQWHFPIFNIADSLIFIGAVLLIIAEYKHEKSVKNP